MIDLARFGLAHCANGNRHLFGTLDQPRLIGFKGFRSLASLTPTAGQRQSILPNAAAAAAQLDQLSSVMDFIDVMAPLRLTTRHVRLFLAVAIHDLRTRPVTVEEVEEIYAGEPQGDLVFDLLPAWEGNPNGLGWIYRSTEAQDRGQAPLRLTLIGYRTVGEIAHLLVE